MVWFGIALIGCTAIAWQDFKYRLISLSWYIVLAVALIGYGLTSEKFRLEWTSILANLVFVSSIILLLFVYVIIKEKKPVNPFENYIGLGDLLFFIVAALCFNLGWFILFMIGSLVFALLAVPFVFLIQGKDRHIPLAGLQSICLSLFLVIRQFELIQMTAIDLQYLNNILFS